MSDMNSLLDSSIDDLADLPDFAIFPAGLLKVTLRFEEKEVNKHPSVELKMKLVETIEMADATETPLSVGTESSVLYMLDNEFGQGALKAVAKTLASVTGTSSLRDTLEAANGMEVQVVSKPRFNKDKTQQFTNITKVIV
jgi:hypothetical protein